MKISETIFHKAVHIGEIVSFYIDDYHIGNSSITISLKVKHNDEVVLSAEMIFVNVGEDGHSTKIKV